jgi:hypothetical protein
MASLVVALSKRHDVDFAWARSLIGAMALRSVGS